MVTYLLIDFWNFPEEENRLLSPRLTTAGGFFLCVVGDSLIGDAPLLSISMCDLYFLILWLISLTIWVLYPDDRDSKLSTSLQPTETTQQFYYGFPKGWDNGITQWLECSAQDRKILSLSPSHAEHPLWEWPPYQSPSSYCSNKPQAQEIH